jgi:hypothetical protein
VRISFRLAMASSLAGVTQRCSGVQGGCPQGKAVVRSKETGRQMATRFSVLQNWLG